MHKCKNMQKNDLVSVIIPAYNCEKHIKRALDSVVNQAYKAIEIIVVNDGSTDSTEKIVSEYALGYSNIKLIYVKNGGVSKARNIGIDASQGKYIVFLDADDEYEPNAIKMYVDIMQSEQIDIITAKSVTVVNGKYKKNEGCSKKLEIYVGKEAVKRAIDGQPDTYAVWGKCIARNIINDLRFNENFCAHEDGLFVFECLAKENIRFGILDEELHKYHITLNSLSRSFSLKKLYGMRTIAEIKEKIISDNYPDLIANAKAMKIRVDLVILDNIMKYNSQEIKKLENTCIKSIRQNSKQFFSVNKRHKFMFLLVKFHLYKIYKSLWRLQKTLRNIMI